MPHVASRLISVSARELGNVFAQPFQRVMSLEGDRVPVASQRDRILGASGRM